MDLKINSTGVSSQKDDFSNGVYLGGAFELLVQDDINLVLQGSQIFSAIDVTTKDISATLHFSVNKKTDIMAGWHWLNYQNDNLGELDPNPIELKLSGPMLGLNVSAKQTTPF